MERYQTHSQRKPERNLQLCATTLARYYWDFVNHTYQDKWLIQYFVPLNIAKFIMWIMMAGSASLFIMFQENFYIWESVSNSNKAQDYFCTAAKLGIIDIMISDKGFLDNQNNVETFLTVAIRIIYNNNTSEETNVGRSHYSGFSIRCI